MTTHNAFRGYRRSGRKKAERPRIHISISLMVYRSTPGSALVRCHMAYVLLGFMATNLCQGSYLLLLIQSRLPACFVTPAGDSWFATSLFSVHGLPLLSCWRSCFSCALGASSSPESYFFGLLLALACRSISEP